ncbi:response regulator [Catenovulum sp. SM1970]|uniref:response regulator n=1 Tax=Marinifaba aquimaris TaxID=2741323 RepID=UPI0015729760|nr:response regulator [Marinifaba aquimaris]NTS75509.1 response regulator [Marinifaba aquimaris]
MQFNTFSNALALIIDDCPLVRTSTKSSLTKLGFLSDNIDVAADVKTALALSQTRAYALIICDYNLGKGANGYHYFDEAREIELISPDTVFIIATGDSSRPVVRKFAELAPDAYLIKPLSFAMLESRIPRLLKHKKGLTKLKIAYAEGNFTKVITGAKTLIKQAPSLMNEASLLLAKSQENIDQIDEAIETLNQPQLIENYFPCAKKLIELLIKQSDYDHAKKLLKPMAEHPIHSGTAQELLAEIALYEDDLDKAKTHIEFAKNVNPQHIHRQIKCSYINLAQFNLANACHSALAADDNAQLVYRHDINLTRLCISLLLDQVQFADNQACQPNDAELKEKLRNYHYKYATNQAHPYELVAKARIAALNKKGHEAHGLLEEYHASLYSDQYAQYHSSLIEKLDYIKCLLALGELDSALEKTKLLKGSKEYQSQIFSFVCLAAYVDYLEQVIKRKQTATRHLTTDIKKLILDNQYLEASAKLAEHLTLLSKNEFLLNTFIQCLTCAWPPNWSKAQVIDAADFCKGNLIALDAKLDEQQATNLALLAEQLEMPELDFVQ